MQNSALLHFFEAAVTWARGFWPSPSRVRARSRRRQTWRSWVRFRRFEAPRGWKLRCRLPAAVGWRLSRRPRTWLISAPFCPHAPWRVWASLSRCLAWLLLAFSYQHRTSWSRDRLCPFEASGERSRQYPLLASAERVSSHLRLTVLTLDRSRRRKATPPWGF